MIEARSVAQVRSAEEVQFARLADGQLMQRAATGLSVVVAGLLSAGRGAVVGSRVVLLVGSGNNGGDALWAGAMLARRGVRVDAVTLAARWHEEGATALRRAGGHLQAFAPSSAAVEALIDEADIVVDGILGIGGSGGLREGAADLASRVARVGAIVVAVDVPSGVDADTGAVVGAAVSADVTVTFGAVKPGLLVAPGVLHAGAVTVIDIGLEFDDDGCAFVIERDDVADWVPEPAQDDYKYRRAVVGVSAGSRPYPGAALLATSAARRANVGMTRFLDRADGAAPLVVNRYPDVVMDGTNPADQHHVDAWACGPGYPGDADDAAAVTAVLAAPVPVVLDAGALTIVAESTAVRDVIRARHERGLVTVLTPHEGEFARIAPGLLDRSGDRVAAVRDLAHDLGAIIVLKGPGTIIASPDGQVALDTEGTADLGTAGSGDVLTGITGAMLAGAWATGRRDLTSLHHATAAAVWIHGAAGRLAGVGAPVVATDIADAVPAAIREARFGPIGTGP